MLLLYLWCGLGQLLLFFFLTFRMIFVRYIYCYSCLSWFEQVLIARFLDIKVLDAYSTHTATVTTQLFLNLCFLLSLLINGISHKSVHKLPTIFNHTLY